METTGERRQGLQRFAPGLARLLRYDRSWFRSDLAAGLSVAAVALPVGIAHAELVRVPTEFGIYAAIFPLFVYALFGGSRQLIVGPDSATTVLVAASLATLAAGDPERYLALMVMLTLITGLFLIIAGFLKLGFIANFLSQPILAGLLNGIALVMVIGQMRSLLGYTGTARGFFPRLIELFQSLGDMHGRTIALGLGLLVALFTLKRLAPKLPAILVVLIAGLLLVRFLGLDEHGVRVLGTVPAGLPAPSVTLPTFLELRELLADGASIALLAFVSGILTIQTFARRNREEVDASQELIGLGAANIASGIGQGFVVTGATSRTAVNSAAGAKSQLSAIVAALVMIAALFTLTAPLAYVPKAALAAVLVVSGVTLFDFGGVKDLYKSNGVEFAVSMVATVGVLVLGVLPGVGVAVGLALGWLLYVGSRPTDAVMGKIEGQPGYYPTRIHPRARSEPGTLIYRFNSGIVFFNAQYFKDRVRRVVARSRTPVEWLILDAGPINHMDVTGLQRFDELVEELGERGIRVVVANLRGHHDRYFSEGWKAQREQRLGRHIYPTIGAAVKAYKASKAAAEDA